MTAPYRIHAPAARTAPVVFASAHSGRDYPAAFIAASRLSALALRRSEDAFVDALFAAAPDCGAPLIAANFPRAWCDVNREQWELDPAMFSDALPPHANTTSSRVQAGLGTIARIVAAGEAIYRERLTWAEADGRLRDCWRPWHAALAELVSGTRAAFGACLLIDCHSMPVPHDVSGAADFVLGDAHGTSCAPAVTRQVEQLLQRRGYRVARNDPYAGGYITCRYGRPRTGVHALQVEVARSLYLDEATMTRSAGFAGLQQDLDQVVRTVTQQAADWLRLGAAPAGVARAAE